MKRRTYKQFMDALWQSGRIEQQATREEIIEVLGIIADDMMRGEATVNEANTLIAVRYALQNNSERSVEYNRIRQAAVVLGSQTSEAKARAARENGKRGGRPKARPL